MKNKEDIINQLAVSYCDVSDELIGVLEKAFDNGIIYGNKNIIVRTQSYNYFYYERLGKLDEKDKIYKDSIDSIIEQSQEEISRKENDWKNKSLFKRIFKI